MTHQQIVLALEPGACIEKTGDTWQVRRHPDGPVIGSHRYKSTAWQSARMKLFYEGIMEIISSVPVAEK